MIELYVTHQSEPLLTVVIAEDQLFIFCSLCRVNWCRLQEWKLRCSMNVILHVESI